ncbi:hypothetical protein OUZ56_010679 [Daphnia magna]|uniref:Uncharacterized protein n=1 Tax=Daphnia magna TaxID=35525 RepID=A0ABR0AJA7_9CRUS|nr:hypothetical protein OUZ56_010679 [Daphnia magna]
MEVKTLTVVLTTFILAFVSKQKESLLHSSVSVARTIPVSSIVPKSSSLFVTVKTKRKEH